MIRRPRIEVATDSKVIKKYDMSEAERAEKEFYLIDVPPRDNQLHSSNVSA